MKKSLIMAMTISALTFAGCIIETNINKSENKQSTPTDTNEKISEKTIEIALQTSCIAGTFTTCANISIKDFNGEFIVNCESGKVASSKQCGENEHCFNNDGEIYCATKLKTPFADESFCDGHTDAICHTEKNTDYIVSCRDGAIRKYQTCDDRCGINEETGKNQCLKNEADDLSKYTCPSADFYGCISNTEHQNIVLNCEDNIPVLADICDNYNKVCVEDSRNGFAVAYCDDKIPDNFANACQEADDDDYVCVVADGSTWSINCYSGAPDLERSQNCTASAMPCQDVEYSGKAQGRCICSDASQCTTHISNAKPTCNLRQFCDFSCDDGYTDYKDDEGEYSCILVTNL